ncbi:MAG: leucine--tRNA ligase, partial [Patescibacteria group bacterium]
SDNGRILKGRDKVVFIAGNPEAKKSKEFFRPHPSPLLGKERGITRGLINGLDDVDWPSSTKAAQLNWIGKSIGTQFKMNIEGTEEFIEVFTTRIDTVFGMTYAVVAPEHGIIQSLKDKIQNWDGVEKYLEEAKKKTDLDRMEAKEKTGVELKGVKVVNPFNNEAVPLFVADYVLGHYGTGAVMAVPAHDERDFEFAKRNDLEIRKVIDDGYNISISEKAFTDYGWLINSGEYDGKASEESKEKLTAWLEENNLGQKVVNYKLRDWLVSRQRYWGAPIPIIYCDQCGEVPVPESDLPVVLPDDVSFLPTGESPLKYSESFQKVKCPKCGGEARRESDTMDTFVCSSWYYLRYADPKNTEEFASKENLKKWLPVDLYVGGAEHTVLHLLYSRFFTKVLHKLGLIDFDEPFSKLRHQGIILAEDGTKMSKSKGNVVNPDEVVEKYGADALRMFEMFMGPLEDMKPWNTKGIIGVSRFLERTNRLVETILSKETENPKCLRNTNKTIKKVSEDIENLKFNTAIAALMEHLNYLEKATVEKNSVNKEVIDIFIKLLAPFAPHTAEYLWSELGLGHETSIFQEKWPEYDPELVKDEEIEMVIQINGKVRGKMTVGAEISEDEAREKAMSDERMKPYLEGKEIKKVIFVKGKLINFVV